MALEGKDFSASSGSLQRRLNRLHAVRAVGVGVLALSIAACAVAPPEPPMSSAARQSRVLPASRLSYVLEPGDEVEISFYRTPELNQHQLVRPDGGISLAGSSNPNARDVQAADLTVRQLRESLARLYGAELKDPDITVTVKTFGSNTVYVMGEVGRPGMLPLAGAMTALQAISAAEGFKSTARSRDVLLIRPAGQGRASWQILNLGKGLGSADFTDDLRLAPHDILYVPRSPIGNIDEFVDLYLRRILPIQPGIQVPVS